MPTIEELEQQIRILELQKRILELEKEIECLKACKKITYPPYHPYWPLVEKITYDLKEKTYGDIIITTGTQLKTGGY